MKRMLTVSRDIRKSNMFYLERILLNEQNNVDDLNLIHTFETDPIAL